MQGLGQGFWAEWLAAIWFVLAQSGPYLLLGFTLAGFLRVAIPERWIAARIGGDDLRSVFTASLIGVPVPLCSCSVVPTAMQLRRGGASKGATTSLLISTPEIGVESVGVTWALMDPLMTILRPIAAFFTALVAGTLVNGLETGAKRRRPGGAAGSSDGGAAAPAAACEAHDHHGDDHGHGHAHAHDDDPAPAEGERADGSLVRRALRYAFGPLLDDLAPWFVLGFLVSGLIIVWMPADFFSGSFAAGWYGMLLMLFAGVPLYVCASASTPVAASLMAKGLDPGAALVLMLAGPATNIATILVVRNMLGTRVLWAYLGSIAVCSLAVGALANALYPFLGLDPTAMRVTEAEQGFGPVSIATGALLGVLIARSAWRQRIDLRFGRWLNRMTAPIGFAPRRSYVLALAGASLALAYASTSLSVVRPGETGFLLRFGRLLETVEGPAHRVHAPWPFTRLETLATGELRTRDYGLERPSDASRDAEEVDSLDLMRARVDFERLSAEAEVLTGDNNLLAVRYSVHYRVADARAWRFGHEDPDALVGVLAEGALRAAVARMPWRDVLVDARAALQDEVGRRLQERVDALGLGAHVAGVRLCDIHAPPAVHPEFRDIASAAEDRVAHSLRAQQVAVTRLTDATAAALSTVRTARAEATLDLARVKGRVSSLDALSGVWRARPETTRLVLWFDALERNMAGRKLLAPLSPHVRILTYAPGGGAVEAAPPPEAFRLSNR